VYHDFVRWYGLRPDSQLRNDARWSVVERIAASPRLKPSARLCQFLLYVADCAIRGVPEEATEQQIGMRVFGRPPGYNSSEDSIVRTHARLLRQKMTEYLPKRAAPSESSLRFQRVITFLSSIPATRVWQVRL